MSSLGVPNARYYGWRIAAVGLLCSALSSPGQTFILSLFLEHIVRDLGVSRVGISSVYGSATLLAAVALPFIGKAADLVSTRTFLPSILLGIGASLMLLGSAHDVLGVALGVFLLRLLGQGAIGLGTLTATVRWFEQYRARALAFVTLGYAAGELTFPAPVIALNRGLGWRFALLLIGSLYMIVFAPFVYRILRDRDVGDEEDVSTTALRGLTPRPVSESYRLVETLRTAKFWSLLLCVALSPMVLTALIFHQIAIFRDKALPIELIPLAFATYAAGSVAVTLLGGFMLERVPARIGVSASLCASATGMMWMSLSPAGPAAALVYGGLIGAGSGMATLSNTVIWPDYFGIQSLGTLKGLVNGVRTGATAAGPVLGALLLQVDGSTRPLLTVFAVVALVGATAVAFIKPPHRATAHALKPSYDRCARVDMR